MNEAVTHLAPLGITVRPLDEAAAIRVLAAACNPTSPTAGAAGMAETDAVITGPAFMEPPVAEWEETGP